MRTDEELEELLETLYHHFENGKPFKDLDALRKLQRDSRIFALREAAGICRNTVENSMRPTETTAWEASDTIEARADALEKEGK